MRERQKKEKRYTMVNKDQLEQTNEGQQVLALMAEHFSEEQFQPALTLIEQLFTEDQTVWDAELNHDSKLPFIRTTPAHRLLVFFEHPDHLAKVKKELERRQLEALVKTEEASEVKTSVTAKSKPKARTSRKAIRSTKKVQRRRKRTARAAKKKTSGRRPGTASKKRSKPHGPRAKPRRKSN